MQGFVHTGFRPYASGPSSPPWLCLHCTLILGHEIYLWLIVLEYRERAQHFLRAATHQGPAQRAPQHAGGRLRVLCCMRPAWHASRCSNPIWSW